MAGEGRAGAGTAAPGALLRGHRERRGLTQEALAERAGARLSVATISNLERGRTRPHAHTLAALADALRLDAAERDALLAAWRPASPPEEVLATAPPSPPAPAGLPLPLTSLVGREREAAAVAHLLHGGARLVTLTGLGGVGKTRLALRVAEEVAAAFPAGVVLVDLASLADPATVLPTVARALGLREAPGVALAAQLAAALHGRRALLVLDNLEQVAAAGPALAALLNACPALAVLATSRAALRVRGEQEFPVPPLALPDPRQLPPPELLARYGAVRLFIERARAVKPDFAVTTETAPAVAAICARLDGLPLAIELAAARARFFTPAALLARLGSRLNLLTGGAQDLPPRQRTLRAVLDWSYGLLGKDERELFGRLGVFAGGFDLEAAAAVGAPGGGPDVLAGMASLVEQSLLVAGEAWGDEPRFRMLETVREYALARLAESGEAEEIARRHAAHYLGLAQAGEQGLAGPGQEAWLERLDTEHDNLQAALAWGECHPDESFALQLASALTYFWWRRGYLTEGRERLERAIARAETGAASRRGRALAQALCGVGVLIGQQGDRVLAHARLVESVGLWRALGDAPAVKRGRAEALAELARMRREIAREPRELRPLLEESLGLCREIGDKRGEAHALTYLASFVYMEQGEYATGRVLHEASLALLRELGDTWGIAIALNDLGEVARGEGDDERAGTLYTEALALFRVLHDPWYIGGVLHNLGYTACRRGEHARAASLFRDSLDQSERIGNKRGVAESVAGLGAVTIARGRAPRATRLLAAAQALLDRLGAELDHTDRLEYDRAVARSRAALDETAWTARWAEGRAMSAEETVAYARESDGGEPSGVHPGGTADDLARQAATGQQRVALPFAEIEGGAPGGPAAVRHGRAAGGTEGE